MYIIHTTVQPSRTVCARGRGRGTTERPTRFVRGPRPKTAASAVVLHLSAWGHSNGRGTRSRCRRSVIGAVWEKYRFYVLSLLFRIWAGGSRSPVHSYVHRADLRREGWRSAGHPAGGDVIQPADGRWVRRTVVGLGTTNPERTLKGRYRGLSRSRVRPDAPVTTSSPTPRFPSTDRTRDTARVGTTAPGSDTGAVERGAPSGMFSEINIEISKFKLSWRRRRDDRRRSGSGRPTHTLTRR